MSTPAPVFTCTFTSVGFFRGSSGIGIRQDSSALRFSVAAIAGGNRIPVRARFRMAEERADALIQFRTDDVFEPAGLRVGFRVIRGESIFEEALR